MTVEPSFLAVAAKDDCCAATAQPPACGDECGDEGCGEESPAPDNCPNKNNPFRICGCCNTFVLHPANNYTYQLTPAEPRTGNKIAFYQAPRSSAALTACWRPPRA